MKKLAVATMLALGIALYAQTSSTTPAPAAGDAKGAGQTAPAFPSAQTQEAPPRVPEPELVGAVYYLESPRNLKPLPRQPVKAKGHPGFFGAKGVIEIPEPHASFRIKAGADMKFVIRVANGIDPSKYGFYRAEAKGNRREILIAKVGFHSTTQGSLPRDVSKYGESSYMYTVRGLAPGEYAFVADFEAFSLGIDPQ